ncbi:NAD-dependent epimerase/dehydratase family protein [Streptomyces armeniacus]|uniref:NAD-dependent epimerase/dehydratase family protein n=1 Tax=Streptomyces armeniacus TaxID=83291 RepID=A0A345XXX5_9ACTN|nr:NAD-dependent epimerase/dehydratase family protein [Streptomyces armeniacus]AXK36491.1 NAD-dependent epimerase/dehydratase family protein [Streptomyces armeniacus]
MEIIGRGFFAANLEPIASAHPDVTALAAGVSRTRTVPNSEYLREAALVHDTIRDCVRRGRTLLFLSTASASLYGDGGRPGEESDELAPTEPFGRHKLGLEADIRASGVRHLIVRLTHAVGPHQTGQLLLGLVRQLRSGTVEVYKGACRDLIDVADAVTLIDELLRRGVNGEVVNIASGFAAPVEDIIDHLETRLGGPPAERRMLDAPSRQAVSIEKLRRLVPAVSTMGFGPGYHRTVIDRYAAELVGPAGPGGESTAL